MHPAICLSNDARPVDTAATLAAWSDPIYSFPVSLRLGCLKPHRCRVGVVGGDPETRLSPQSV